MIFLELFWAFLQVGMFSIGGGYAAMPLIQAQAVDTFGWLTAEEFSNLVTIAEMTPGPIAVNAATFVGVRIAGIPGAIAATLGCIFPSLFIVSLLAFVYFRFKKLASIQSVLGSLRPVIVALIASAGLTILFNCVFPGGLHFAGFEISSVNFIAAALFCAALTVIRKFKWNPILTMALCGALYTVINVVLELTAK